MRNLSLSRRCQPRTHAKQFAFDDYARKHLFTFQKQDQTSSKLSKSDRLGRASFKVQQNFRRRGSPAEGSTFYVHWS